MGVCGEQGEAGDHDEEHDDEVLPGMKASSTEARGLNDSDDDDDGSAELARKEAESKKKDADSRKPKVTEASADENAAWGQAAAQATQEDEAAKAAADQEKKEAAKATPADNLAVPPEQHPMSAPAVDIHHTLDTLLPLYDAFLLDQ